VVIQATLIGRRQGRATLRPRAAKTMTHHNQNHDHHGHAHQHHPDSKIKGLHKNWITWAIVALMLGAMLMYVLSDDESLRPGAEAGPGMPAAEGPPADAAQ
jgi:hypothetical protein